MGSERPWLQQGYVCTDTSTGEERLRGEVAAAWHRDRTATDFAAAESSAHEAQVRVWNGSDAYGQSAVARNWYARLYLARWRQRLAETAKSAATRMGSGASVEARAAAVAAAAQAFSVAVGERTRAARNLAFSCAGARKRAFLPKGTTGMGCRG